MVAFHPLRPETLRRARRLLGEMTDAEERLWQALRAHRLMGLSGRRQAPIGPYVADFLVPAARLVIELDGNVHGHDRQIARGQDRDAWLNANGFRVVRFWNDEIMRNLDQVCYAILLHAGMIESNTRRDRSS